MGRSWKDPFVTLTFPNKVIFTILSILLFLFHIGILINDLYHFLVSQNGTYMSFHFTFVLLVRTPAPSSAGIGGRGVQTLQGPRDPPGPSVGKLGSRSNRGPWTQRGEWRSQRKSWLIEKGGQPGQRAKPHCRLL